MDKRKKKALLEGDKANHRLLRRIVHPLHPACADEISALRFLAVKKN